MVPRKPPAGDMAVDERFDAVVERESAAICDAYRISAERAASIVRACLDTRLDLRQQIASAGDESSVRRTAAYRAFVKAARRAVYYALRRYREDDEAFAALIDALADAEEREPPASVEALATELRRRHVSTAEREPHLDAFLAQIDEEMDAACTVIDVGCGCFPLSLSPGWMARITRYVAMDRDAACIRALEAYARATGWSGLEPRRERIGERPWSDFQCSFDIGLLLKLVPVMARSEPDRLGDLASVPARRLIVTANCGAMARHTSIRGREKRILDRFVEQSGRAVVRSIEVPTEFGYVLE
ncbi:hypothetical protein FJZ36_05125 [Candidatus Poribacteria bacterium]|nr:hypothetical protein [Candidatus Poribacteria bacterium]